MALGGGTRTGCEENLRIAALIQLGNDKAKLYS